MTAQEAATKLSLAGEHLASLHDAVGHLRGTPAYAAGASTYLGLIGEHQFLEGAVLGASPSDFQAMGAESGLGFSFLFWGGTALAVISAALGGMIGKHLGESDAAAQYYTCLDRQYDAGMSMADASKICGLPIERTGLLDQLSGVIKWGSLLVAAIGALYTLREVFQKTSSEAQ